jgi:hypothetical protein
MGLRKRLFHIIVIFQKDVQFLNREVDLENVEEDPDQANCLCQNSFNWLRRLNKDLVRNKEEGGRVRRRRK